ncbi:MAG: hypothetical protein HQ594_06185 [Candidatus Omnitrophica bacterium]|nr:hypothetical protein [Candidatus Omnitrophota bacterium]
MKEHPIIFSSDMILAILKDRKTQTRRVIKPQPCNWVENIEFDKNRNICILHGHEMGMKSATHGFDGQPVILCPYQVGMKLWVREVWSDAGSSTSKFEKDKRLIYYKANPCIKFPFSKGWKSPIFMPRWASRITLEITDVRVERVQEISLWDAKQEGLNFEWQTGWTGCIPLKESLFYGYHMLTEWKNLWNSIHKKQYRWEDSPWVWIINFKRIKK